MSNEINFCSILQHSLINWGRAANSVHVGKFNSSSSVFYFCTVKVNRTQQYRISNANGHRKGKKQQNDQRCNMLARMKLEDEGISRHGRNTAT